MEIVPLQPVPSQTLVVVVGGQITRLNIYQKSAGLFMDVLVNETLIVAGVICQELNRIVRDTYLGFIGDFCFIDNQGNTDPVYTGLGDRYSLAYLTPEELEEP